MRTVSNKTTLLILFLLAIIGWHRPVTIYAQPSKKGGSETAIRDAIVRIFTVKNQPDYFKPWSLNASVNVNGSGCIIEGERILTNAHLVADHSFIQVRRHGQVKLYKARVLVVSHEADLALLTTIDKTFFKDVEPLRLMGLPRAQQEVLVYGYPFGGSSLSITKGILSRIEHRYYSHSGSYLLAGQIDAAINPGNSGGPVLVKGRLVGVVMQTHGSNRSENIGYMSPAPIIQHFFRDIEDGKNDGFPDLGIITQNMENPSLKFSNRMSKNQTGVLVTHVFDNSSAKGKIEIGDIMLEIDGVPIAGNGSVEFRPKERTRYTYYADIHQLGATVDIKLLRKGSILDAALTLDKSEKEFLLVPKQQYDRSPRYFIHGGFVFTQLTQNYIKLWGSNWKAKAPKELLLEMEEWPTDDRKETVLILRTLAADINKGYHNLRSWVVRTVNGKTYKDFDEFHRLVTTSEDEYITLRDKRNFQVVINRKLAEESHKKILRTYRIRDDCSPDFRN
ncbi:trypsin-like peptidase domain-containing protein [bacterium]|nr:trypsin-like peptidase domain-containing protein [bacterium]